MQERERTVVGGLVVLLLVLTLGFYVHRNPRFPGSLAGGMLGISGAALMVVPLVYLVVKRVRLFKRRVTRVVSMRTLLTIHISAGVLGPILGVIHSGHRFQSGLGIALTAMMIVVALSGFVGRYLMGQLSKDMRSQQTLLAGLRVAYERTAAELVKEPERAEALRPFAGFFARLAAPFFLAEAHTQGQTLPPTARALRLAESMADVEYGVRTNKALKDLFGRWLACHIVIAVVLYGLLAVHVWSAWYFGIRWLA